MHLRRTRPLPLLAALLGVAIAATEPDKTTSTAPCTASSTGGAFYDLRPDIAFALADGAKPKKGVRSTDYVARGHDYGSNFTVNICGALVKPPKEVVGIDDKL